MVEYFLTFDEHHWMVREPDHDNWDYGESDMSVTVDSLYKSTPRDPRGFFHVGENSVEYECYDVAIGDNAYVVVVEYYDGDTFGSSGYWALGGVYDTLDAALECVELCEGPMPSRGYRAWDGYFAILKSAWVEPMVVKP